MGILRKVVIPALLLLAGLCAVIYALDDVWARYRGRPVVEIKVDRGFSARNRWSQIEYSISTPEAEKSQTCVQAMLPHFGYAPCWYLIRHTIQQRESPRFDVGGLSLTSFALASTSPVTKASRPFSTLMLYFARR